MNIFFFQFLILFFFLRERYTNRSQGESAVGFREIWKIGENRDCQKSSITKIIGVPKFTLLSLNYIDEKKNRRPSDKGDMYCVHRSEESLSDVKSFSIN